jgi:hypothetical protein
MSYKPTEASLKLAVLCTFYAGQLYAVLGLRHHRLRVRKSNQLDWWKKCQALCMLLQKRKI